MHQTRRSRAGGLLLSRSLAALLGGYVLANLCAILIALFFPHAQADAVLAGMLLSFLIYAIVTMWVFAARSALRAWVGVICSSAALAAAIAGLRVLQ